MQSRNPVLSKAPAFQGAPYAPGYGQPTPDAYTGQPYPGPWQQYPGQQSAGQAYPGQQYPGQAYPGQPAAGQPYVLPQPYATTGTMTIDDVLTKTAITMGLLIASAAASFKGLQLLANGLSARASSFPDMRMPMLVMVVTGAIAFGVVLLVSFRRKVNPAFVLAYSVIEGVFIGAISLVFEYLYPGIVLPAAFGTFVAAGVTLAAYKLLRIRVSSKFRKMVAMGTMAIAGVYLINFVLSLFGVNLGIVSITGPVHPLAMLMSVVGVGLAVFNLILDFDYIEQGVRAGAPATESWRAAFGLTVTMVWLYTELLRILSYFNRS